MCLGPNVFYPIFVFVFWLGPKKYSWLFDGTLTKLNMQAPSIPRLKDAFFKNVHFLAQNESAILA